MKYLREIKNPSRNNLKKDNSCFEEKGKEKIKIDFKDFKDKIKLLLYIGSIVHSVRGDLAR